MNDNVTEKNPLRKWVILLAILASVFFASTLYFGFFFMVNHAPAF